MRNITIAIDGYSSTGKSTIAKMVAKALGYIYVDSGAMYRAVTLYAIQNNFIDYSDFHVSDFLGELDKIKLEFRFNPGLGYSEIFLNGENVERAIRTMEVSNFVSQVAVIPEIRRRMVQLQHKMGENKAIVMDGRDIGTVVFPKAELKIFMTASPEIRAKRRFDELLSRGEKVSFDEVFRNVQERDHIDSNREDSPLIKANDAIEFDNSELSIKEQYQKVMRLVRMTIEDLE
ncbi:MAG: (d)CMP kinase [Flavobacteriaceae bacterium]|nr:(d)CMP kinase [Bacteroidia bacterium]MBT8286915.1 (d)CMP kinase [Bacteroidia bacterium]NNF73845.1 (d)CMP kinase [Flavobacteriaceae bacterium]NNK72887.1 (d)CMP kinase [Flavobacteriaceae bacterium]